MAVKEKRVQSSMCLGKRRQSREESIHLVVQVLSGVATGDGAARIGGSIPPAYKGSQVEWNGSIWNGSKGVGPLACHGEAPSKTDRSAP